jgi:hypothetical protein
VYDSQPQFNGTPGAGHGDHPGDFTLLLFIPAKPLLKLLDFLSQLG